MERLSPQADDDGRTEFKLESPITIKSDKGERTIEVMRYRKPIAKDLFAMPMEMTMKDLATIACKITGETIDTIGRMDLNDFMRLQQVVQGFLASGQGIGDKD